MFIPCMGLYFTLLPQCIFVNSSINQNMEYNITMFRDYLYYLHFNEKECQLDFSFILTQSPFSLMSPTTCTPFFFQLSSDSCMLLKHHFVLTKARVCSFISIVIVVYHCMILLLLNCPVPFPTYFLYIGCLITTFLIQHEKNNSITYVLF